MRTKYIVKYIDYGTGNRVGNTIYLNKNLKEFPKLREAILTHEERHTGGFKFKDFWLDFNNEDVGKVRAEWLRFMFKYPKAWANFFPVLKLGNRWCWDISLTIAWFLLLFMLFLIWHSI